MFAVSGVKLSLFAALASATVIATPASAQTITAVMQSALRSLDPTITTAYVVRNFGYMVYDTLLALDAQNNIKPQMLASWQKSADGKTYTFTLRDGLKWDDGSAVTGEDCIASINRWMALDKMGQVMKTMLSSMKATGPKTFVIQMSVPTDIAIRALAKPSSIPAFMMPKRLADAPVTQPLTEVDGSGPFKFVASQYKPGVQAVFVKNDAYVPRSEPASGMAGGKVVNVQEVKWVGMPDTMTSVNALVNNEVDFVETVTPDMLPMVTGHANLKLYVSAEQGGQNAMRFNFEQPPFDNKLIRLAAMYAMNQKDVLEAQMGDPKYYKVCYAVFGCGSPYETTVASNGMFQGNIEKAKALLKEAHYDGTPVVVMQPTDYALVSPISQVVAEDLRKAGFKVNLQAMDWQTVINRRASHDPAAKGGWNIFTTYTVLSDIRDPLGNAAVAANGKAAWFGWPTFPEIENLRAEFAKTDDPTKLKAPAGQLQTALYDNGMSAPMGQFSEISVANTRLTGILPTPVPVFWSVKKSGT